MRRLIALIFLVLVAGIVPAAAGGRVALVIGNGAYGRIGNLPNPPRDARGMEKLLKSELGFDTVILSVDANHEAMYKALIAFGRASENADVALFYYAGHGIELDDANYLLPIESDIRSDADLVSQGYRLDQIVQAMVRAGAKTKMLFIDACRNNPLPTQTRGARSMGLKAFYVPYIDTLIAFAAEPGRVAYDGEGDHSPFTAGLLDNLATPGVNIYSILLRVRSSVYKVTDSRQFPWWDDYFSSEVFLRGAGISDDVAACNALGNTPSAFMMEAYLDQYPEGFCAGALRKRMRIAGGGPAPAREPAPPGAPLPSSEAPAPVETAAADAASETRSANVYSVSSYWVHNGSVMALSAQGASRVFYYYEPRKRMADAGVVAGTLLFKGQFEGRTYKGQAYLFSKNCAPVAYPVSGRVSNDFRRVELVGDKPVRDGCRQIGTISDRLVFDYRSKKL